jgi:MFS family permease
MAYGSGYVVNYADIAPAYSSIIFAVSSTISTIGALICNIIAGFVIKQPILEDWRKLFILFTILYIIGGVVFLLYGSAVPRKWATFNTENSKQKEEGETLTMLPRQTDIPSITKNIETNHSIHLPE